MKKVMLTISVALISWMAAAQVRESNNEGMRLIISESRPIYATAWRGSEREQRYAPYLSVTYATDGTRQCWTLSVELKSNLSLRIHEGAKLLVLLGSGEILELVNASSQDDKIGHLESNGMLYNIGGYVGSAKTRSFSVMASYEITMEIIQQIVDAGVQKIRIELSDALHDEVYLKKDRFTEAIRDGYSEVSEYLRQNPGDERGLRDVYEGFSAKESAKEVGRYNFFKAKASGAFYTRKKRGETTYYDPDTKAYLTREEFLKKYEEWELEKLEKLED